MDAREFRAQTREILEHTLNQLQAATLLVAELESQVSEAGRAVQGLTQMIEQYVGEAISSPEEASQSIADDPSSEPANSDPDLSD